MDNWGTPRQENADSSAQSAPKYVGFGIRLLAYLVDSVVLSIAQWVVVLPIMGLLGINPTAMAVTMEQAQSDPAAMEALTGSLFQMYSILIVVSVLLSWLYFAYMESSEKQATLGKLALGLKVTDSDGNRVSFGTASVRFFSKIVSGLILCIGYLMIIFDDQKRALHDRMASTLVLFK